MKTIKHWNLLALSALLLTACNDANHKPIEVDKNFGLAYKQVTQAQILNPSASENPPPLPSKVMNGQQGEASLNAYRSGFSTIEITDSVDISSVSNNSSSN